ncbi:MULTISPECIES: AraC family transcriptional regulator [unclassified Sphingopyxis]|uniref:AraC family transcriptional regulator n=1 Tax=unclassified Sphingopyxis TaxID=2614943 RepID=UPI0018D244B1|nr:MULTISPECIES: AraC family transcriptional regulator [unclassified Sphingopyxis]MDR7059080.1 AraC family transcriptional regulator [Sphingopyxis sp. BE235]MDR7178734.1 AraC family transcriptional regulator [Sphingopyxis sp. BE249]
MGRLRVASIVDRIDGPSNWTIERDVHVLILYEAGSYHWLETWLDDQRTSLGDPLPGEMWLIPAGQTYRGTAKGGAVRTIEVEIPVTLLTVAPDTRALAAHHDLALAALVRALLANDAAAADPLVTILAKTLQGMAGRPESPAIAQRINDLMAFIQTQLEVSLTVEDMAAEAGMSVNSLIVHFARATGRTPAQYVLHQRLRHACWFLMNRPLSIAEIAFATGFSSHAHLCAIFRRKIGMSPGDWRRRHRSDILPDEGEE